jgi:ribosomal protein S21
MIEVKKNENESPTNLVRRFTKKIRQAGILKQVRNLQFRKRKESPLQKKKKAIKKEKQKEKMQYLWELGKIERKNNE